VKLRIACAIRSDPGYFEAWHGRAEWEVEGVGTFAENPRARVGDDEWALIAMYRRCDKAMSGRDWPDGRAVLDQPMVLIEAFDVIAQALYDFDPKRQKS